MMEVRFVKRFIDRC